MMVLEKYDVKLVRLTEDKIEQVRCWRNDDKIRRFMIFREEITPEMQSKWFEKINNKNNYYFLINVDNKDIGLINIRDIDYNQQEGEAGIFIYEDEYLNGFTSFKSTLCLYDFFFETLKMNRLTAQILETNKNAIKFNKMIGFEFDKIYDRYVLTKSDYIKQKENILQILY